MSALGSRSSGYCHLSDEISVANGRPYRKAAIALLICDCNIADMARLLCRKLLPKYFGWFHFALVHLFVFLGGFLGLILSRAYFAEIACTRVGLGVNKYSWQVRAVEAGRGLHTGLPELPMPRSLILRLTDAAWHGTTLSYEHWHEVSSQAGQAIHVALQLA